MRKGTCEDAIIEIILCWPSTVGGAAYLRVVYFPSESTLDKQKFSFVSGYQLEIASGLDVGAYIHFCFQSRTSCGEDSACSLSRCDFMCVNLVDFHSLVSLVSFIPC